MGKSEKIPSEVLEKKKRERQHTKDKKEMRQGMRKAELRYLPVDDERKKKRKGGEESCMNLC